MDWTDRPIDLRVWKRVRGNPFADYDPADGIALWSLWEMPSCSVGPLVRRGRPRREPTAERSVRLGFSAEKIHPATQCVERRVGVPQQQLRASELDVGRTEIDLALRRRLEICHGCGDLFVPFRDREIHRHAHVGDPDARETDERPRALRSGAPRGLVVALRVLERSRLERCVARGELLVDRGIGASR